MKILKSNFNKALSVLLSIIIALSVFAGIGVFVSADSATNPHYSKVADAATLDGWKNYFGSTHSSTENAGAVWTDKSVFADASAFTGLTDAYNKPITPNITDRSFLVALSAIAANKSIMGYSHTPTDTVLILDVSGSMGPVPNGQNASRYNDAVAELTLAANAAVDTLLKLNSNNRVGVVLYSGNASQFLAVDRYTAANTISYDNGTPRDTSDDRTIGEYFVTNNSGNRISMASGVKNSKNQTISKYSDVTGATYIQDGIMEAADVFKDIADANDTIISGNGFQSGIQRKPVVVLMSDGAPTYASTDYKALSNRDLGSGTSTSQHFAFLTQLTAAYAKKQITQYYNGSEALFYTLGLGVGSDAVAESTLNPANSTTTIASYWEDYDAASNNARLNLTNNVSITVDSSITDINYTNGYFSADTKAGLFDAFDKIVNQIIIQSLYRPTLIEENNAHMGGYIEFIDDIGDYMHVHSIEGIMIGNKLYTGQKLAENFQSDGGELGTVNSPNALGNNLIGAVQQRLGIEDINVARQLVKLAYEDGQLRYTSADDYSNYIGWYADEDGNFLDFWDKDDTYADIPTIAGKTAKYINKSYGMLGEIKSGMSISDLMYVSIQVHTEIAAQGTAPDSSLVGLGHSQLIFRVPASLIPVVSYDITLEGTSYESAKNIEMNITDAEPIRLLFEVGLRHDINEFNIDEMLANAPSNVKGADGKYRFYTNEYSVEQFENEIDEDNPQYIHPTDSINTLSYFEPSHENERYYYTESTPIYVKSGSDYVKYSSNDKPVYAAGKYFRKLNVFEYTPQIADGNAAELLNDDTSFEEISASALSRAVKKSESNGWDIPKNTIHRYYDHVDTKKVSNETDTLEYSFFLAVEHAEGEHYYSDAILGNNGLLTVTPATGLSIAKTVDATLLGTTEEFAFRISNPSAAGKSFTLTLRSPENHFETLAPQSTFDANGDATISLKADWTAYITDIPTGDYTVTEVIPANANYEAIEKPTGAITVTQNTITPTFFKNALKQSGYLTIAKEITHPFGASAPATLFDKTFSFEVTVNNTLLANYPDAEIEYFYASDTTTIKKAAVANNKLTITVTGNDTAILKIRENWTVSVREINLPTGFTNTNVNATDDKTITTTHNVEYTFVNNYSPAYVTLNAVINASKQLTGKPWTNSDVFSFTLNQYDATRAEFVTIATESVAGSGTSDTQSFGGNSLTSALNAIRFSETGSYHFSISENVPQETHGITYDTLSRNFHVEVTDNDTDGFLEATIHADGKTSVAGNVITAEKFVNTYKADGIAEVTLEVNKSVTVPTGTTAYALNGFKFGLFNKATGTQIGDYTSTDANGIARFVLTFNADNVTANTPQTYSYELREIKEAVAGMTYAAPKNVVITVTDNLDGTIKATTTYNKKADGAYIIPVENIYNPDDAKSQVIIDIEKTINNTGTATITPEGFKFEIAEEIQATDTATVLGTVTSDLNGKAQFALDFTPEDLNRTRIFTVKEINEGKADVTYSTRIYRIEVRVTLDNNNKLIATATSADAVINGNTATTAFKNTYSGNLPEVKLESTKTQAINGGTSTKENVKVVAGDTITYSITIKNIGEIAATDIKVTDVIPEGLIIVSNSITENGVNANGTITWTVASLAVGEEITVSFKVTVPEAENGKVWKNIALTTYDKDHDDTPDTPDDSNEVIVTYEVPESPKTGDASTLHLWLALAVISGSGTIITKVLKKKKEQENN